MTISYSLAPNPKWYIADLVGRPLGGGYMATFRSLDKSQIKVVFQDPAGNFAWPYVTIPNVGKLGVLFDENGSQGPFYWEFDTDNPDELYYLEIYDTDGVLQWTIDNFSSAGGGGGSVITTALDLENLVANNVMYRNVGTTQTPLPTFLKLAPGANAGLSATTSNAGPDICFIKNNTNAVDQISFPLFTLGSQPVTGDIAPVDYLKYTCSNNPAGETQKVVQFPITSKVQNLSNQNCVVTIWAKGNAGTLSLDLQWRQFFGNGVGASPDVLSPISTLVLTNSWQKFTITGVAVPDATGKVLGGCGNDGLFLQVQFPLGASCDIDFTKPSVYLGTIAPDEDYHTYDMIDGLINTPRTGDYRFSMNDLQPFGWVPLNDGTIGNASSNATTRANLDTFPLYNMIWTAMQASQIYAPMYNSAGAAVAYTDPITDFTAGNQLSLTKGLGQVIAGTSPLIPSAKTYTVNTGVSTSILNVASSVEFGTATPVVLQNSGGAAPTGLVVNTLYYAIYVTATTMRLATTIHNALNNIFLTFSTNGTGTNTIQVLGNTLGLAKGEETHLQTAAEVGVHTHTPGSGTVFVNGGAGAFQIGAGAGVDTSATTGNNAGGTPFNVVQPTTYANMYMKL